MNPRKLLSLTLALACILALFSGCAGQTGGTTSTQSTGAAGPSSVVSDVSGKVRVLYAGQVLEDGIDPLTGKTTRGLTSFFKQDFEPKYPNIDCELTVIPWDDYTTKTKTMLLSNQVDVVASGGTEKLMYDQGLLMRLNDLIDNDKSFTPETLYLDGIWNNSVYNKSVEGDRYGLPALIGQRYTVYDKKLFDDWGVEYLSEKPTPEEILEKAKQMTGINPVTGEQNYGLYFEGNDLSSATFSVLGLFYDGQGYTGDITDDPKAITWDWNSAGMVKVMQWLAEASKYCNPGFITNQGNENFGRETNTNAIVLNTSGSTVVSDYKMSGKTDMMDRFIPVYNLGKNGESWLACDNICLAKSAQNVDASWEVCKYLASADVLKYMYEDYGACVSLKDTSFVDPNDIYYLMAIKEAEIAPLTLFDVQYDLFLAEVMPYVAGFVSLAAQDKAPDIQSGLDELQAKAVKYSTSLK